MKEDKKKKEKPSMMDNVKASIPFFSSDMDVKGKEERPNNKKNLVKKGEKTLWEQLGKK